MTASLVLFPKPWAIVLGSFRFQAGLQLESRIQLGLLLLFAHISLQGPKVRLEDPTQNLLNLGRYLKNEPSAKGLMASIRWCMAHLRGCLEAILVMSPLPLNTKTIISVGSGSQVLSVYVYIYI